MKWTEELEILKENYPKIGCAAEKMFPKKTYSSVMTIQQINKELNVSYNEIKRYIEGV